MRFGLRGHATLACCGSCQIGHGTHQPRDVGGRRCGFICRCLGDAAGGTLVGGCAPDVGRWRSGSTTTRQTDQGVDSGKIFSQSSSLASSPPSPIGEKHIPHDTVGVLAIDTHGVMAGACSTSGMPFKLAGRVGDSPIPGHGIYVDPEGGGAVATGMGEFVMGVSGSFLAVECMRRGSSPLDAVREVLERIDRRHKPLAHQQVGIIALATDGKWSAGALCPGFAVTISDASGIRSVAPELVLRPEV